MCQCRLVFDNNCSILISNVDNRGNYVEELGVHSEAARPLQIPQFKDPNNTILLEQLPQGAVFLIVLTSVG